MSIKTFIIDQGMFFSHQMAANPNKDKKLYLRAWLDGKVQSVDYVVVQDGRNVVETKDVLLAAEVYDNL